MASTYVLVALLVAMAMTSASASLTTSCVNITLSNILNIGTCVGSSTNFCGTTATGAARGLIKVINCVIQGIYKYGSPLGIVTALEPLMMIYANRLFPTSLNLGTLGTYQLCNSSGCLSFLIKNDSCVGSINIGLPATGNLSSCAGDTTLMCTAGSPTTTNLVQPTMQAITCTLNQLPMTQLQTVLQGIACQLVQAINLAIQQDPTLQLTFGAISTTLSVLCIPLPILG